MMPASRAAWMLIALVLGARLAAAWHAGPPTIEGDPMHYHDIATNLAAGNGFAFSASQQMPWEKDALGTPRATAVRPPLYPIFLSLIYRAGLDPFAAVKANALLAALTAWLLYRLSRRVGLGDRAACVAITAYLVYPPFTVFALQLVTENLFVPLLLAGLLMVVRVLDRRSIRDAAVAGLFIGLAALTRPVALLLPGALAPILLFRVGRQGLAAWTALAVGFALALTPWVARNALVFGRFQPSVTSSGHNLFMGTFPGSRGRSVIPAEERPAAIMAAERGRDEFGLDSLYRAAALRNLRDHPVEQIPLAASKFIRCWFHVADPHMFQPTIRSLLLNGPPLLVGLLGWYGLWRRHAAHAWLPVFVVSYSMFAHMTTIASVRFNLFSWPFVFMGVGWCVDSLGQARTRRAVP